MLKPLGGRVIVRPDTLEAVDPAYAAAARAGIEIVSDNRKREEDAVVKGTVVSISSLAFSPPVGDGTPWVTVGARVYYAKYAGKEVIDPDTEEKLLLLNDEDLCVEIEGEKND